MLALGSAYKEIWPYITYHNQINESRHKIKNLRRTAIRECITQGTEKNDMLCNVCFLTNFGSLIPNLIFIFLG